MYVSSHHPPLPWSYIFRWAGRICGVGLFVSWVALVALDATRPGFPFPPPAGMYLQAAALAVIFAGYAVGWKHELAGGALVLLGVLGYIAVCLVDLTVVPSVALAWFAVPGLLYLMARRHQRREAGLAGQ